VAQVVNVITQSKSASRPKDKRPVVVNVGKSVSKIVMVIMAEKWAVVVIVVPVEAVVGIIHILVEIRPNI